MDKEYFVKKVEFLCHQKGVKPTVACRTCGLGSSFLPDVKRGRIPSVEKCATLAAYLETTVSDLIGEVAPASMAIPNHPALVMQFNSLPEEDQADVLEFIQFKHRQIAEKEKRQRASQKQSEGKEENGGEQDE